MKTMTLEIISQEGIVVKKDKVISVDVDTAMGPITILPDHAGIFAQISVGVLKYTTEGSKDSNRVALGLRGIIQVCNNEIKIIVVSADTKETVDVMKAKKALETLSMLKEKGIKRTNDGTLVDVAIKNAKSQLSLKA